MDAAAVSKASTDAPALDRGGTSGQPPSTGDRETERSAELLRLALPMITRHGRGFAPISYAVWYEYVRGTNHDLRAELDDLVRNNKRLSESLTFEIYQRHVVDRMEKAMLDGRANLLDLMHQVDDSVRSAATKTHQFDATLDSFVGVMDGDPTPEEFKAHVGVLREEIRDVSADMRELQNHLEGARNEVKKLADELVRAKEEAQLDPLTGLLNRRGFDIALSAQIDKANNPPRANPEPVTLIFIDIDRFKDINDHYGHLFGDKVIQGMAKVMDGAVMRKDFVSRYGGEEFAVILPATDEIGGMAVAERIRETIAQSRIRRANSNEVISNLSVSAGVAQYLPGEKAERLLERADQALYQAKNTGRNRVCRASQTSGG